jgi:hypothetical protein
MRPVRGKAALRQGYPAQAHGDLVKILPQRIDASNAGSRSLSSPLVRVSHQALLISIKPSGNRVCFAGFILMPKEVAP